jgi:hypothetical protein
VQLGLEYGSTAELLDSGDRVRVRVRLGAGSVAGGTAAIVRAVRFMLHCDGRMARLVPCEPDRAAVAYGGDETLTTTCPGVGWSSGHPSAPRPNLVVFTPNPAVEIPAHSRDYCDLEFDVVVAGGSRDATPGVIEQMASVGFMRSDATCDNGLRAASAVGGGLPVPASGVRAPRRRGVNHPPADGTIRRP